MTCKCSNYTSLRINKCGFFGWWVKRSCQSLARLTSVWQMAGSSVVPQERLPCHWRTLSNIIWHVCEAFNHFIRSSFDLPVKLTRSCTAKTLRLFFEACMSAFLLFLEKCNLVLIKLIDTLRIWNILILMSLLSRFNSCQFLFDCPPLFLFLHHLGFSQSRPGLFSVFRLPSCFPQSLDSHLQTLDGLVRSA